MSNPYRRKLSETEFEKYYNKAKNFGIPTLLARIDDAQETRKKYQKLADSVYPDHNPKDDYARNSAYFDADSGFWVAIKNAFIEYTRNSDYEPQSGKLKIHPSDSPKYKALTDYNEKGKPLFLHLMEIAPEIAILITGYFCYGNYKFLRSKEMIEYLDLPIFGKSNSTLGNRLRRKNIMEGKNPFSPIEIPNNNKEDKDKDKDKKANDYDDLIEKKRVLRENILSAVANYFSKQYLSEYEIDGEDINKETVLALQNIIKDYPDILSSQYNIAERSEETFSSYIINTHYRNPLDFFPAFANKRGANKNGYYKKIESSYSISPEEVIWYGIQAGNSVFLTNFNANNASLFTAQNRINEHIENIAKIAVDNPDYLREIAGSFLRNTTYVTEKYPSKLAIAKHFQNVAIATGDAELADKMAKLTSRIVKVKIVNKPSEFMQKKLPTEKDSIEDKAAKKQPKTIQTTLYDFTHSR